MNDQRSISSHFNNWISILKTPVTPIPDKPKPIYKSVTATIRGSFAPERIKVPDGSKLHANLVPNEKPTWAVPLKTQVLFQVTCPVCKKEHTCQDFNMFNCDRCGKAWVFKEVMDGEASLEYAGQVRIPFMHLMMIDEDLTTTPVYILEIGSVYCHNQEVETLAKIQGDRTYFVDQSTCPTNILGGKNITIGVMEPTGYIDTDPHGFLRHVYSVPLDDVLSDLQLDHPSDTTWQADDTETIINYILNRMKG